MKQGIYSIALITVGILLGLLIHSEYDDYKAELVLEEQLREAIEILKSADEKNCVVDEDLERCRCYIENPDAGIVIVPAGVCLKYVDKADLSGDLRIAE